MQLEAAADGRALFRGGLTIVVRQDHSDTWSHGIPAFGEPVAGHFGIERLAVEDRGPVRAAWRMDGRFDASEMALWVRLYCGDPRVEIALWVNWRQKQQVAKLALPLREPITERVDGIPGGCIVRPTDGHEYPVHDWTLVRQAGGRSLGVVCPDSFGLDVTAEALGFTLLRAPPYSWHDPLKLEEDAFYRWTDQGEHTFRFILVPDATVEALPPMALGEHRPPVCHDWTAGMGGA
jgi:alpha-mannosidase